MRLPSREVGMEHWRHPLLPAVLLPVLASLVAYLYLTLTGVDPGSIMVWTVLVFSVGVIADLPLIQRWLTWRVNAKGLPASPGGVTQAEYAWSGAILAVGGGSIIVSTITVLLPSSGNTCSGCNPSLATYSLISAVGLLLLLVGVRWLLKSHKMLRDAKVKVPIP